MSRSPTRTSLPTALIAVLLTSGCTDAGSWFPRTFFESEVHGERPPSREEGKGPPTSLPAFQFLVLGDAGTGGRGQRRVASSMAEKAAEDSTSFVLLLGDNIYESGVTSATDIQWKLKFESVYSSPSLQIPFLAILGNHDYYLNPRAQIEYTYVSTRWYMPDWYYSRSFKADDSTVVQIFCLNTMPMASLDGSPPRDTNAYSVQLRWLDLELAGSGARWKIVAGHHPMYSNGHHGNDRRLANLLEPLFIKHNVDMYLAGHEHDLQLLRPVNGVHYLISGGGGKHRDTEWRENTLYAATNLGFVRIGISHSNAVVQFFNADGKLGYEHMVDKKPDR